MDKINNDLKKKRIHPDDLLTKEEIKYLKMLYKQRTRFEKDLEFE
ncbi:hypothetical protein [Lederbergia galactosidilytica]|nr:hypothetical protein [Lederbergia galactosidilytica]MBP1916706.1 hypothetical protein [Lederbergia galactosidilytica]